MMDLQKLRDYNEWLKTSPQQVLDAVGKIPGGWTKVFDSTAFPDGLPLWAHQVRNFFNLEPIILTRLDKDESKELLLYVTRNFKYGLSKDGLVEYFSLSGDVYREHRGGKNRFWYQMGSGGTIFHYGSDPENAELDAVGATLKGQGLTPIFKLVAPDGTKGSHETIIFNNRTVTRMIPTPAGMLPMVTLESNIGQLGMPENVSGRINQNSWHRGSYNYGETVEVGIELHKKFDIDPHTKYKKIPNVYKNPDNIIQPLSARRFPVL